MYRRSASNQHKFASCRQNNCRFRRFPTLGVWGYDAWNINSKSYEQRDFFRGIDTNPAGTGWIANIAVQNIVFSCERNTSVSFFQLNASSVSNCQFIGVLPGRGLSEFGILDQGTQTGNKFVDNVFDGGQSVALSIGQFPVVGTLTIDAHVKP